MKYLLIFFLSFIIVNPALAAIRVQGSIPEVQPLQPTPVGVYPNTSNNVQFHDPSHDGQFDLSGEDQSQTNTNTGQASTNSGDASASDAKHSSSWLWWVLGGVLILVLGAAWLVYRGPK